MHHLPSLSFNQRVAILVGLLMLGFIVLLQVAPIPQDPDYHFFADTRSFFGIPNFSDTMSNIGFAVAGILGILTVFGAQRYRIFCISADARPYAVFFIGIALIALGSAYYHLEPSNERLLWDRLPMSIAFMAFVSVVVSDRIQQTAGNGWLLILLVVLGMLSLLYWYYTEMQGHGDLRFYAFVQFYPILLLPVVLWLFPDYRYTMGRYLAWVIVWYALSKIMEHFDREIFDLMNHTVSGHTMKHLAAAAGSLVVLRMLTRTPRDK